MKTKNFSKMNIMASLTIILVMHLGYSSVFASELDDAVHRGDIASVRNLLNNGGNVDLRDEVGTTPLMCAADEGYMNIARLLLDRGAKINAKDNEDNTPLHYAASHERLGVVRLLIDRGADITILNNEGFTPGFYALFWENDDWEIFDMLNGINKGE